MSSQPNVDNFEFGVIQDSLGQSMGTAIPNRALMLVCGGIGSGTVSYTHLTLPTICSV